MVESNGMLSGTNVRWVKCWALPDSLLRPRVPENLAQSAPLPSIPLQFARSRADGRETDVRDRITQAN